LIPREPLGPSIDRGRGLLTVYVPNVMYWPGSTSEGSARNAFTTPQSISGRVGKGAKSRFQSASNSGPRDFTSEGVRRSLAQTSRCVSRDNEEASLNKFEFECEWESENGQEWECENKRGHQ
jgi:hypothetical protein